MRHLVGTSFVLELIDVFRVNDDNSENKTCTSAAPDGWDALTLYLVLEFVDTDLHRVIASQPLSEDHVRWILLQILLALHNVHSAGILHRDLKPSNILLSEDCSVRLCDFGLARVMQNVETDASSTSASDAVGGMTEYVVTRWYRPPELLMEERNYDSAIDVWAAGCVFGEMLAGRPLFPGKDQLHQLHCIVTILGKPSGDTIAGVGTSLARTYIESLDVPSAAEAASPEKWQQWFPGVSDAAIDLLRRMLSFSPRDRISVADALAHPFFESMRQYQTMNHGAARGVLSLERDVTTLSGTELRTALVDFVRPRAPPVE
eukprot:PhM_4_TR10391/c0_g1_i1/m.87385/K04371/MAPK1_3; mitogen-activated protein kinase 1/3